MPCGKRFALLEAPFPQPLGRHPLLAFEHRRAAVERARNRVRPAIAEEHRVATHRGHGQVHIREHGFPAALIAATFSFGAFAQATAATPAVPAAKAEMKAEAKPMAKKEVAAKKHAKKHAKKKAAAKAV